MPAKLEIALLGRFDLRLDGETIDLASRPQKKLLAYLALNAGQAIPRAKLAGILWLDSPERKARKNLRHHLWRLRQAIGDEFLLTAKNTAAFDDASDYWLDVEVLEQTPADSDTAVLIEAVSVYRGELLPGFYDDWLLLERERLQAVFERQMQALLDRLTAEARWPDLIIWAEHWIAQAYAPEPAYRALMIAAAGLGDLASVARHYQRCQRALQEDLSVELSAETRALFESLTSEDRLGDQVTTFGPRRPPQLPRFFQEGNEPGRSIFVGRQVESTHLMDLLTAAHDSHQGQVAFIIGDAGSGKTSLMSALAAQASEFYPDLFVAWGTCNAFGGLGDPFLPFRKALTMLAGDVEEAWSAGAITTSQAQLLWEMMPATVKTLLDYGPDLLDTFIPAVPLMNRLQSAFPAGRPILEQLKDKIAQQPSGGGQERPQLFEQVVALLRRLAEQRPIIFLLDDLQWADRGSIELLFYLGRSLSGTRLLLLGAYRPDEIAATEDHLLRPALAEFRRSFGDVWLDLNQSSGRGFVDEIIDTEANRLDESFRETFFKRTGGHALFTVELLRDMQERGDLVKDDSGAWAIGPALNWEVLPARVEGAVQSRLGRLEEELHAILKVAAVEGELFTAQVVAQVKKIGERSLLQTLSRELGDRYKLVQEDWTERVGQQMISRYRFAHQMFQRYLYNDLPEAERRLLHGQVGQALENLHQARSDEIVAQLARHFDEAGASEKAASYLLMAGDRARLLYANEEAIGHYRRALEHLQIIGDNERRARAWMRLGLTYHNAFDYQRSRQAYDQGFVIWQEVSLSFQEYQIGAPLYVWLVDPTVLDSSYSYSGHSEAWLRQLFSGLVQVNDELVIVPDVARRWQISEDGLTYTFHLREEVKWSDGHPLTAGDFVLAWRRKLDPRTPSHLAQQLFDIRGARDFHLGQLSDEGQLGLRAPDAHTLIIELEQPTSYFLHLLATAFAHPVPKHMVAELGEDWADPERIVTNGPYMIADWASGQAVSLTRNPHYHGSYGGNVSQVEVLITNSADDWEKAMIQFGRGELDVIEATLYPGDALSAARAQFDENYLNIPNWTTFSIAFNSNIPPLDNVRLRRALAMAIEQDRFVRVLSMEQAVPANGGWVAAGLPGHSPDAGLPFNPSAARRLIAEAGYPNGKGLTNLKMVWPDYPASMEQADYLSRVWQEQLGITIQPIHLTPGEWRERLYSGPPAIFYAAWTADFPDPDNFLRIMERTGQHNERFQTIIDAARSTIDQQERLDLYRRADKLLMDNAYIIPLSYGLGHYFVSTRVRKLPKTFLWQDIIVDPD